MFMYYILQGIEFIEMNPAMVFYMMGIVEYVKRFVSNYPWYRGLYMTIFGFALGFLFAIPESGFARVVDPLLYASQSIALGLVATGIYKVSETLVRKIDA